MTFAIPYGHVFQIAGPHLHISGLANGALCLAQHLGRLIDGDHPLHTGRERQADLSGAASQIGNHPVGWQQGQKHLERQLFSVHFVPELIPAGGGLAKKEIGRLSPLFHQMIQPFMVLADSRPGLTLLPYRKPQRTEILCSRRFRQAVEIDGPLLSNSQPSPLGEYLQMATYGGLRQQEYLAKFHDA